MKEIPFTVEVIEKLRLNCHLGKHKHFEASGRGRQFHLWFGVPTVAISVVIGSAFFVQIQNDLPDFANWVGAGLGLTAAMLSGIQTFFNFRKEYEAHRVTGNKFLHLARECERLIALYFDGQIELDALSAQIEKLNERYAQITTAAESISTNRKDYSRAKALQDAKEASEPSLVHRVRESPGVLPNPAAEAGS